MDYSIPVLIITVIVVVAWLAVTCSSVAAYAMLRATTVKDVELYKARTASLTSFLITFLSIFVLALIFIAMLGLRVSGTNEDMADPSSPKAVSSVNSNAKYIYGLAMLLNIIVFVLAIVVIVCSIYMLIKVRSSSTYKTNPDDTTSRRVIAAAIVNIIGSSAIACLTAGSIFLAGFWWSKTAKLEAAGSKSDSHEDSSSEVGEALRGGTAMMF